MSTTLPDPNKGMLVSEAIKRLQQIHQTGGSRADELTLQVRVHRPGSIGGSPTVGIESIHAGFDWDHGKVMLYPVQPVTRLTEEEVAAITKHAKDGQSYRAYQDYKKIKALEAEVARLLAFIAAGAGA